jgi:hypothetical protein
MDRQAKYSGRLGWIIRFVSGGYTGRLCKITFTTIFADRSFGPDDWPTP